MEVRGEMNQLNLEEIVETIRDNPNKIQIGDSKDIKLYTGEVVKITLIGKNHDKISDGSGTAKATFITTLEGLFPMEPEGHNTYRLSRMRNTYLPRIFKLLPPVLGRNIVTVSKPVFDVEKNKIIPNNADLWFLSENEVFGKNHYSNGGEGEQYEFFTGKNKIKSICPSDWWLRSPKAGSRSRFCCVGSGGDPFFYWSGADIAVVFGFCI